MCVVSNKLNQKKQQKKRVNLLYVSYQNRNEKQNKTQLHRYRHHFLFGIKKICFDVHRFCSGHLLTQLSSMYFYFFRHKKKLINKNPPEIPFESTEFCIDKFFFLFSVLFYFFCLKTARVYCTFCVISNAVFFTFSDSINGEKTIWKIFKIFQNQKKTVQWTNPLSLWLWTVFNQRKKNQPLYMIEFDDLFLLYVWSCCCCCCPSFVINDFWSWCTHWSFFLLLFLQSFHWLYLSGPFFSSIIARARKRERKRKVYGCYYHYNN